MSVLDNFKASVGGKVQAFKRGVAKRRKKKQEKKKAKRDREIKQAENFKFDEDKFDRLTFPEGVPKRKK